MKLNETTVAQNTVFSGRIITVRDDEVVLENGKRTRREVVYHHGGVCVVPFDGENTYLVRQFRYPYKEVVRESPAGKLEPSEDPLECGKRELEEELGAVAGRYTDLGRFYPSPGYTSEVIHLYLAEELSFTPVSYTHLQKNWFPLPKCRQAISFPIINAGRANLNWIL